VGENHAKLVRSIEVGRCTPLNTDGFGDYFREDKGMYVLSVNRYLSTAERLVDNDKDGNADFYEMLAYSARGAAYQKRQVSEKEQDYFQGSLDDHKNLSVKAKLERIGGR